MFRLPWRPDLTPSLSLCFNSLPKSSSLFSFSNSLRKRRTVGIHRSLASHPGSNSKTQLEVILSNSNCNNIYCKRKHTSVNFNANSPFLFYSYTHKPNLNGHLVPSRNLMGASKAKYTGLVKQYGKIVVVFHSAVWVGTLAFFNLLVFNGVDVSPIVEYIPFVDESSWSDSAGDDLTSTSAKFLIAYTITSITGPVRLALDVAAAPWLSKTLSTLHGSAWKDKPK